MTLSCFRTLNFEHPSVLLFYSYDIGTNNVRVRLPDRKTYKADKVKPGLERYNVIFLTLCDCGTLTVIVWPHPIWTFHINVSAMSRTWLTK